MAAIKRFCYYTLLLSLFLVAQVEFLCAQDNDSILFAKDIFEDDIALDLTLKFDIKKFIREKMDENYLPATLSYFINDTIEINTQVRIKSRGIIRKKICYFPPYFINIKNTGLQNNLLSDFNKVKVVSHCENTKRYNNYLLKEYLTYKIFNIITDYSFKVRLLNVKYIDEGRKDKTYDYKAFLIEPEKLLAERVNAYPLEMDNFIYAQTDTIYTTVMSIFQYMIGNTDYSITGRHNTKLVTLKDFTKNSIIPIPYDFDYSGIVNAPYARPQLGMPIAKVTERCFYGMCRSNEVYNEVLELFTEKKDEIFTLIRFFEYIDEKTRNYLLKYLEEFYDEIEHPKFIEKKLRITCDN